MLEINLILSRCNSVIGVNNNLLFNIKDDLKFFRDTTSDTNDKKNIVIMGYNTWISIPSKYRPLNNRINIVLTKDKKKIDKDGVYVFSDLPELFRWLLKTDIYNKIFFIGGETIYNQLLKKYRDLIKNIYITEIYIQYLDLKNANVISYFKDELNDFDKSVINNNNKSTNVSMYSFDTGNYESITATYEFCLYTNKKDNLQEDKYIKHLEQIIKDNNIKQSRNSNVYHKFGINMEFNLLKGFPLLTTKKMPWKTILRELIWFINGETDNKILNNKNVHIWDLNSTKDFLSKRNLDYEIEGDLGPIYGFQWRHFGAQYIDCDTDYKNQGVDQLKYVIDEIKNNPTSRRIIMSSWNPVDLPKMALPPCHVMIQFNIDSPYIDAQLYQRSGDMFLGVPFNIASYSFLLSIIGKICNYIPRKLIHIIGDAHIYEEHLEAVNTQVKRKSHIFPRLEIETIDNIDNIKEEQFKIVDYTSESLIKAIMIP